MVLVSWAAVGVMLVLGGQAAPTSGPAPFTTDWERRPSERDFAAVFPVRAMTEGRSGRATVECRVTATGAVTGCRVIEEDPPDYGFGAAALALTPQFRMRPPAGGQSVEGATVRIPIAFRTDGAGPAAFGSAAFVARPRWEAAPSRAEVAAARGVAGSAVVRCTVTAERTLRRCDVVSEAPARQALGVAARRLADRFRLASPGPERELAIVGARVDVRVQFGVAQPATLTRPAWVRAPTAAEVQAAFAASAASAADRTARATVDCEVGRDGGLIGCHAVSASAAEAGAAAVALAGRFAVTPWTDDGLSNVGARVRLPLRYVGA